MYSDKKVRQIRRTAVWKVARGRTKSRWVGDGCPGSTPALLSGSAVVRGLAKSQRSRSGGIHGAGTGIGRGNVGWHMARDCLEVVHDAERGETATVRGQSGKISGLSQMPPDDNHRIRKNNEPCAYNMGRSSPLNSHNFCRRLEGIHLFQPTPVVRDCSMPLLFLHEGRGNKRRVDSS